MRSNDPRRGLFRRQARCCKLGLIAETMPICYASAVMRALCDSKICQARGRAVRNHHSTNVSRSALKFQVSTVGQHWMQLKLEEAWAWG